ncbi:MAG: beta-lactamase family protein [Eubacterium sp.]|nr:beta-lactamase family protein [Eubacterium sp.]
MSTVKDLDNLLERFVREKHLPGASLSVCQGENLLYENCIGSRDMAGTVPMDTDTLFRIHSVTKPMTSLCGMLQYERGVFLMDDPVYEYLPEYRNIKISVRKDDGTWAVEDAKETLLIRHLFNMNVGYYAYDDSPTAIGMREVHERLGGSKMQSNYSQREEIRAMAEIPMLFEPGTRWQYDYGLNILSSVIEESSGMSLGEFMKKNIFEPLGMKDTGFRFRPGWRERMAECVQQLPDGGVKHCDDVLGDPLDSMYREEAVYEAADAGLISNLRDVQAFAGMLANGGIWKGERIIGRKTLDMMRHNLQTKEMMETFHTMMTDMKGYGYGYGVRTMVDPVSGLTNSSVGEFGWVGAAGPWMMADPSEKLSASFMIQDMLPDGRYYHHRLRAVINGLL